MTLDSPPATAEPAPDTAPDTAAATSTKAARVLVLVTVAVLLLLRLPRTIDTVREAIPDQVVADVGDPHLLALTVNVAALIGVAVTLLSVMVFLWLAALLERHLCQASIGTGRLRIGAFTATVAACCLVTQVRGLVGTPSLHAGATPALVGIATGVVVGALFAWRARLMQVPTRASTAILATAGLALAMSVTTLSV